MNFEKKEKLKNTLDRIGILGVLKYLYRTHYFIRHKRCESSSAKRITGYNDKKFEKLKRLKDIHKGQRCFIVATGPSLTVDDLEKLKDEITFSMNSIIKIFDKTDWRPTYYGIQDSKVYDKLCGDDDFRETENKLVADFLTEEQKISEDSILFPIDLLDHMYYKMKKFTTKFSENAYGIVYDGATITYSIMQIAYYMGFKEVYLLGCDCDYSQEKKHFADYGYFSNDNPETRLLYAYSVANEFAKTHDFKIYNATRGGKLEIFERVDLDSIV